MKYEIFESSHYYHVYNRGNNRENLFKSDDNYQHFIKLIGKYLVPIAEIYSYCLLPNHFHIILRIKDDDELPISIKEGKIGIHQPFSNMFNAYAKAINKKYNRTGSLFQKQVKRIRIVDDNYLIKLIIYVNTNSDHHNFGCYTKYKYTSYHDLIKRNDLIVHDKVIELFGDMKNLKYQHQLKKEKIELKRVDLFE